MQKARDGTVAGGSRLHNVSYATSGRRPLGALWRSIRAGALCLPLLSLPAVPGVSHGVDHPAWGYLDNGIGYLLLESHAAPLIGSSVIVHSGSAREDFATSGASHFLEHLLFNGTEKRTQEQLYDDVDAIGAYNNATTRRTHVAYMMLTPAEKIREGLEIQADMLFHSTLPPEKVEKERGIILEELAKDQDQGDFELDRLLTLAAFGPEGPGLPILGSVQSIRSMSRDAIAGFYRRFYTPQNMTLVVIGDFESSEMEALIRETFGAETPGESPPPYRYPQPQWNCRAVVATYPGNSLVLEWVSPGPDPSSADFLAFECLIDLLTTGDAAPLNRAVRDRFPNKILSAGGSIEIAPARSYFKYRIEADRSVDHNEIAAAVPGIFAIPRLTPVPEEIDAWKVARETEEYFLREKPHYYATLRGDRIAARGIDGILDLPQRLAALGPADVEKASSWLAANAYRLAVVLPAGPSLARTAVAGPVATTKRALPNGAELLVLSSPESPVLALHLFLRGRSEAEPEGMDGAVELLHRLMTVRTRRFDPPTLQRRIRSIGADLKTADNPYIPYDDFYSTNDYSYLRLQSLDRYAQEAFELLTELLATPAWTDEEFEEERRSMLSSAERSASSSRTIARALVQEALYAGTLWEKSVFGTPEALRAMTPDALRVVAARYLVGRRILLVVATSLTPEVIADLAERTIAHIPAGEAPADLGPRSGLVARIRSGLAAGNPSPEGIDLPLPDSTWLQVREADPSQARITRVLPLGRIDPDDFPAVEVWNAKLSNEIQFQLREREGLAYSIGSSVERLEDGTILWTASAGANRTSLGRILEGFGEHLAAALERAPEPASVTRQGIQIYGRSLMRRATRMNRAYAAGAALLEGRDPAGVDEEIRAPTKVTAEQIERLLPVLRQTRPGLVAIAY